MIKFTAHRNNKLLIGLGISEENVRLLKLNKPILVDLSELGVVDPIDIVIFYGKTEDSLARQIFATMKANPTTTAFGVPEESVPEGAIIKKEDNDDE